MEYKDYYATLGVDKKASADEIKQSYRRLARKYHPDVSKEANAEEKFKNVQEAYEVLKDPEKRKAYDELGSNWKAGQDFRPPPGWQGGSGFGGQGFNPEDMEGFSDFFSHIFGGSGRGGFESAGFRRQRRPQKGQDQHAKVSVTLEEAYRGAQKTIQLQMPVMDEGHLSYETKTLKINIPAGATTGQQLRLGGQGAPSPNGGQAGDLYLEIELAPHALFTLQDKDVYVTLPVAPWEAALGADVKVPTLGGTVGLKLAAGSQSGQKLRLRGRGMPSKSQAGDQYAIIQVVLPKATTPEQQAIFKEMAEKMPFNPRPNWPQ